MAIEDGYTDSRHVFDNARDYRAWFFISFQQLPVVEQERALPWLREIVFDEFVPEYSELPLSFEESDERRWFIRILPFGEKALIALFREQGAKDVTKLGIRGRDRYYEMNERQQDRDERLNAIDDRLRSIDEQLACLLGPDRTNRNDQFDRENALDHLLDQMLNAQEKTSVYVFHGASYPICSEYCELLWTGW